MLLRRARSRLGLDTLWPRSCLGFGHNGLEGFFKNQASWPWCHYYHAPHLQTQPISCNYFSVFPSPSTEGVECLLSHGPLRCVWSTVRVSGVLSVHTLTLCSVLVLIRPQFWLGLNTSVLVWVLIPLGHDSVLVLVKVVGLCHWLNSECVAIDETCQCSDCAVCSFWFFFCSSLSLCTRAHTMKSFSTILQIKNKPSSTRLL